MEDVKLFFFHVTYEEISMKMVSWSHWTYEMLMLRHEILILNSWIKIVVQKVTNNYYKVKQLVVCTVCTDTGG